MVNSLTRGTQTDYTRIITLHSMTYTTPGEKLIPKQFRSVSASSVTLLAGHGEICHPHG